MRIVGAPHTWPHTLQILEGRVVPKVGVAEVVSLMNQFASNTLGQDPTVGLFFDR